MVLENLSNEMVERISAEKERIMRELERQIESKNLRDLRELRDNLQNRIDEILSIPEEELVSDIILLSTLLAYSNSMVMINSTIQLRELQESILNNMDFEA